MKSSEDQKLCTWQIKMVLIQVPIFIKSFSPQKIKLGVNNKLEVLSGQEKYINTYLWLKGFF